MNTRNNAFNSNILFGSTIFSKDTIYQVQDTELPGIEVNHVQENTRVGHINIQGSTSKYNPIKLTVLVDEDLKVWKELIGVMQKYHIPGTNECEPLVGDSWIEFRDNRNNYMFKVELKNCYISSVSNLSYSTTSNNESLSLDIELIYDYFEII